MSKPKTAVRKGGSILMTKLNLFWEQAVYQKTNELYYICRVTMGNHSIVILIDE